jgi:thiamine kinase-like enzyme
MDSQAGRQAQGVYGQFFELGWPQAVRRLGELCTPRLRLIGDRYAELLPWFIDELSEPKTVVHGELRGDNLFFDTDGQPVLVDFQTVQLAAGMVDVAYLLSQSLDTDLRYTRESELIHRYHETLLTSGVSDYSWDKAWRQYQVGVMAAFTFPVMAMMQYDITNDRGRTVLEAMLKRGALALHDHSTVEGRRFGA